MGNGLINRIYQHLTRYFSLLKNYSKHSISKFELYSENTGKLEKLEW